MTGGLKNSSSQRLLEREDSNRNVFVDRRIEEKLAKNSSQNVLTGIEKQIPSKMSSYDSKSLHKIPSYVNQLNTFSHQGSQSTLMA
jgi:phosphatidate phosphatase PAH1